MSTIAKVAVHETPSAAHRVGRMPIWPRANASYDVHSLSDRQVPGCAHRSFQASGGQWSGATCRRPRRPVRLAA